MCSVSKAIELYPHFYIWRIPNGLANGNRVHKRRPLQKRENKWKELHRRMDILLHVNVYRIFPFKAFRFSFVILISFALPPFPIWNAGPRYCSHHTKCFIQFFFSVCYKTVNKLHLCSIFMDFQLDKKKGQKVSAIGDTEPSERRQMWCGVRKATQLECHCVRLNWLPSPALTTKKSILIFKSNFY